MWASFAMSPLLESFTPEIFMKEQSEPELLKTTQTQEIVRQIVPLLKDIRFGSIEIVIHDGRIVQIDRHEKFRANALTGN